MKTVSSILSLFERQLAQLESIETQCGLAIDKRSNKIANLRALNSTDLDEAKHANRVAKKIQDIIQ